jgi:Flp pilus assembly pilin Flp
MKLQQRFFREESGQDSVEYALLIAFVSATIIAGVTPFINGFNTFWNDLQSMLSSATSIVAGS